MGGLNRFRPLKRVRGAKQVENVREYKAANLEEGLCAAMSLRWLQDGTVPEEFAEAEALQKKYAKNLKENKGNTGKAIEFLAGECGLKLQGRTETGTPSVARKYWIKNFGAGRLGTAILTYANGELRRQMDWDVRDWMTADPVPCFIWFHLDVPEVQIVGETLADGEKLEFEDGSTVAFSRGVLMIDKDKYKLDGEHGVALKRVDSDVYRYFDPNAGEYEIAADALGTFFDTVYRCYRNFHAEFISKSEGVDAADVDLQLVRIYAMRDYL